MKTHQINVRLSVDHVTRIDTFAREFHARFPALRVTRTMAFRILLDRGLEVAEREHLTRSFPEPGEQPPIAESERNGSCHRRI